MLDATVVVLRRPLAGLLERVGLVARRGCQRDIDLFITALGLLALLLAMGVVWLANRWTGDRGPLFYKQARYGKNRRVFVLWKLRSQYCDLQHDSFTRPGDPRVTKVGRVIRKYRIDELAQFINVARGDMAVGGPRPMPVESMIADAKAYDALLDEFSDRFLVNAGITGSGYTDGRACTQWGDDNDWRAEQRCRFGFEVDYARNPTLRAYLGILIKTPGVMLSRLGVQ